MEDIAEVEVEATLEAVAALLEDEESLTQGHVLVLHVFLGTSGLVLVPIHPLHVPFLPDGLSLLLEMGLTLQMIVKEVFHLTGA